MGAFSGSLIFLLGIIPLIIFFINLKKSLQNKSVNRFDLTSRFSRSEHASRFFIILICNVVITIILDTSMSMAASGILAIPSIALMIYYYYIAVRRLHDLNLSGWHSLLFFVPFVNLIFLFCLLFVKGTDRSLTPRNYIPENLKDDV